MFNESIKMALDGMVSNKLRTFLTLLGIIIGVGAVIAMVSLGFVVALGIIICSMGVQKGVEKISKPMMIALLVIMVILAVNSVFLPGASEGVKFYLIPDVGRMMDIGFGEVVTGGR